MKKDAINRQSLFLAALSGILLTGSFPKIGLSWLVWFALTPLLCAIRNRPFKEGFLLGLFAGTVHYLTLLSWLVPTMNIYGKLPIVLSFPILLLFAAYLALYPALFAGLCTGKSFGRAGTLLTLPALWVFLEYFRSFFLTGFPWEFLGYALFESIKIIQIADITGVYGVSFLIVLVNTALFVTGLHLSGKTWFKTTIHGRTAITALVVSALVAGGTWCYGAFRLHDVDRLAGKAPKRKVAVIQGNIDQARKWDPAFQEGTTDKYIALSLKTAETSPDLIVWPETATPFYMFDHPGLTRKVLDGVRSADTHFLIGSPYFTITGKTVEYLNSAFLISPQGKDAGRYDKVHLVPFGEYVPLKRFLPFVGKMVEHVGDFRAGEKGRAIPWDGVKLGVQTCFEIVFANLSRAMVENGAAFLVNITNDAWFGKSSAPYQHFSMVVFRAVENRRAVVRSANTGISGFIDPAGRITGSTSLYSEEVMSRYVPVMKIRSVYTAFGDIFAMICLTVSLLVALGGKLKYIDRLKCLKRL